MMQGPPQQYGQQFWQPFLQRLQAQRAGMQRPGMPQGPQPGMGWGGQPMQGQGGPPPMAAGMRPMFDRPQGAPMQLQAAGPRALQSVGPQQGAPMRREPDADERGGPADQDSDDAQKAAAFQNAANARASMQNPAFNQALAAQAQGRRPY